MMSEDIKKFPITPHLNEICQTLKNSKTRFLILTAQTGAGKSTVLPLGLLENFNGKILMTEPRRLAVLGVSNRVASLCNEKCGQTVGYKIHMESCCSEKTRMEVVTEAILVRNLQTDPALEKYEVVVLDEFHERSVNTDLALAFLKEAMQLRDDLYVIIMSATIDTEKLQQYLGENTPVLEIPGRLFPVEISHAPETTMAQAITKEVTENPLSPGNVLAFLPGIADIRKTEESLRLSLACSLAQNEIEICVLHSSISLEEQKHIIQEPVETEGEKALKPRRIILSSAIAETSLTVPGVTCVIDSGLSRINRMNLSTGMENLSTETESEFSATQRCGRAGRTQAGRCIRLWSSGNPRIKNIPAEILRADITSLVLECAERGVFSANGIDWFESPGENAWKTAQELLKNFGLIKSDFHITEKGKVALGLGIHPRLASIALEGGDLHLVMEYSQYAKSGPDIQKKFISDLKRRLEKVNVRSLSDKSLTPGLQLLSGFPDRLAKRLTSIGVEPAEYQFASGRKALLYNSKKAPEWIVAPEVMAGEREGTIFSFEEISNSEVEIWLNHDDFDTKRTQIVTKCTFCNGKIEKNEQVCYGQIVISSKKIPSQDSDLALAWCEEVRQKGLECLPSDIQMEKFLEKAAFYFQEKRPQTNLREEIISKVNDWLPPFLTGKKLTSEIVYQALCWFLNGNEIEKEVPSQIILPNGNKCKISYEKVSSPDDKNILIIRPVIEIIIQRAFGVIQTPRVCGMKVLMRLLSPAGRPLQITDDLENFWTGAWPQICKEMKGRYPKHNWEF